jgi:hypothetical protein
MNNKRIAIYNKQLNIKQIKTHFFYFSKSYYHPSLIPIQYYSSLLPTFDFKFIKIHINRLSKEDTSFKKFSFNLIKR